MWSLFNRNENTHIHTLRVRLKTSALHVALFLLVLSQRVKIKRMEAFLFRFELSWRSPWCWRFSLGVGTYFSSIYPSWRHPAFCADDLRTQPCKRLSVTNAQQARASAERKLRQINKRNYYFKSLHQVSLDGDKLKMIITANIASEEYDANNTWVNKLLHNTSCKLLGNKSSGLSGSYRHKRQEQDGQD